MFNNSILFTRHVLSSTSKIHPFKTHSPSANLYFSGNVVSNLFIDAWTSIPITDFLGPVIPISVMYAVPFSKISASVVCTCVWIFR